MTRKKPRRVNATNDCANRLRTGGSVELPTNGVREIEVRAGTRCRRGEQSPGFGPSVENTGTSSRHPFACDVS